MMLNAAHGPISYQAVSGPIDEALRDLTTTPVGSPDANAVGWSEVKSLFRLDAERRVPCVDIANRERPVLRRGVSVR
jgi:hypothetical protein